MEEMNVRESILQSAFSEKRYAQLKAFIFHIWKSKAKYKILMARRAFNLNYAFMEACRTQRDEECVTDSIMSNTALLLYAEELARYYSWVKKFPDILIADDLLFHGRGIIKLLDNLEALIVECLNQNSIPEDKSIIHEKLLSAVSIYVFAQNKAGLLLDHGLALKAEQYLPMNELRGLSQQISNALQIYGVANTSYVLSAAIPARFSNRLDYNSALSDSSGLFRYRGYSQLYYYKFNSVLWKTIRINMPANSQKLNRMFTSLVTFGNLSVEDFDVLCGHIAKQMDAVLPYSHIAKILWNHSPRLARPRAQMISFLLSIECFVEFFREQISTDPTTLYNILLRSDFQKIITNFGKVSVMRYELIELFKKICFTDSLEYTISEQVAYYAQSIWGTEDFIPSASFKMGSVEDTTENVLLCEAAEDIFYEVGINAECAAASCIEEHKKFEPTSPGNDVIQLNQYLSIMGRKTDSRPKSMGCVLLLMDSGLLSMNMEENQGNLQCVLKSGELAMYVLPRRFSVFIHALAIVERDARDRNRDFIIAISRFIDYLQDYCYQTRKYDGSEDRVLLRKLKESKGILLYMYESRQLFQDWDTELLTEGDRMDVIEEQYGRYMPGKYRAKLWEETARRRYYAYCARTFIRSDER